MIKELAPIPNGEKEVSYLMELIHQGHPQIELYKRIKERRSVKYNIKSAIVFFSVGILITILQSLGIIASLGTGISLFLTGLGIVIGKSINEAYGLEANIANHLPLQDREKTLELISRNDENFELAQQYRSNPIAFVEKHFGQAYEEVVKELASRVEQKESNDDIYSFTDAITRWSEENIILRQKISKTENKF